MHVGEYFSIYGDMYVNLFNICIIFFNFLTFFKIKMLLIVSVTPHCPESTNNCKSDTCYNGGICHEGWNRVICDCSNTEYAGATCMKGNTNYFTDNAS